MRLATRDYARPPKPRQPPSGNRRSPPRKRPVKSTGSSALGLPLWAWMIVASSLFVFAAAIYYISRPAVPMDMAPSSADRIEKAKKAVVIPPKEPSRFAFYEMLPSYEVVVPEEVLNPPKPKPGTARNNVPAVEQTPRSASDEKPTTAADVKAANNKPSSPEAKPVPPSQAPAAVPAPASQPQVTAQLSQGEQFLIQVAAYRTRMDAEARVAALALTGLSARVEQVTIDNTQTWYRVRLGPYRSAAAAAAAQESLKAQGLDGVVMKVRS